MIGNIKKTFPPKTGMQKKQVLQDPGYVKDVKDAYCVLSAKYSNNTVDLFIIFQLILYIVEDVEDIKTNHNRLH